MSRVKVKGHAVGASQMDVDYFIKKMTEATGIELREVPDEEVDSKPRESSFDALLRGS